MPTTKSGEKITWSEFMTRWKRAISSMSPLNQTRHILRAQYIMAFGTLFGIAVATYLRQWWLVTILVGACYLYLIQIIGTKQKIQNLLELEKVLQEPLFSVSEGGDDSGLK